jgi:hypothetical protein
MVIEDDINYLLTFLLIFFINFLRYFLVWELESYMLP